MNQTNNNSDIVIPDLPSYKLFKRTSYAGNIPFIPALIAIGVLAYFAVNIMIIAITEGNGDIPLALTSLLVIGVPSLLGYGLTDIWRKVERGRILCQYLAEVEDKFKSKADSNASLTYYVVVNSPDGPVHAQVGKRIYKKLEVGDEIVVFSVRESYFWALPLNIPE